MVLILTYGAARKAHHQHHEASAEQEATVWSQCMGKVHADRHEAGKAGESAHSHARGDDSETLGDRRTGQCGSPSVASPHQPHHQESLGFRKGKILFFVLPEAQCSALNGLFQQLLLRF